MKILAHFLLLSLLFCALIAFLHILSLLTQPNNERVVISDSRLYSLSIIVDVDVVDHHEIAVRADAYVTELSAAVESFVFEAVVQRLAIDASRTLMIAAFLSESSPTTSAKTVAGSSVVSQTLTGTERFDFGNNL